MRKILLFSMIFMVCVGLVQSYAAEITLTIPNEKIPRVIEAMEKLYGIPTIPDPENPGQMKPEFTSQQWTKECIKRFVISSVARYEQVKAQQAVQIQPDNTIAQ